MSLTVPKAGVVAGRAPQIEVATPTTGADIAEFGQAMQRVGIGLQRERNGRLLAEAKTQMMAGLNDLRLELENSGDPDLIDGTFPDRARGLRDQLLENLPPAIHADAGLAFDDMAERNRFALGRVAMDLRQGSWRAGLEAMQRQVVSSATGADPDTRLVLMEQFARSVQDGLESGALDPEQAQRWLTDTEAGIDLSEARRLLLDDPDALLSRLDAGEIFAADEPARQDWRRRAQAQLDARAAQAEREAERDARERERQISHDLGQATQVLKQGRMPQDVDALVDLAMQHPELGGEEFGRAMMLAEKRPDFLTLPPAQMRAAIEEEAARPISDPGEHDILTTMRDALAEAEAAWRDDPIGTSAAKGLGRPNSMPDPAQADAADLTEALVRRSFYAASLLGDDDLPGYIEDRGDLRLFDNDERAAFRAVADKSAPPAQRARLASAFAVAFQDEAPGFISEVSDDPVFGFVGGLLSNGGDPQLAHDIFEGQRAIARQDVPMPSVPQRRQAWFVEFESLFDREFEDGMRDTIIAAADALYARRASGDSSFSTSQISETAYLQAVHEVLGGTGDYSKRSARGGVQSINGALTLLPPGLRGRDVVSAWDNLARHLSHGNINAPDLGDLDDHADRVMREISATGTAPRFGGQAITARSISEARLRAIGDGRYMLVYEYRGQPAVAHDEHGDIWELDIFKLMERPG